MFSKIVCRWLHFCSKNFLTEKTQETGNENIMWEERGRRDGCGGRGDKGEKLVLQQKLDCLGAAVSSCLWFTVV